MMRQALIVGVATSMFAVGCGNGEHPAPRTTASPQTATPAAGQADDAGSIRSLGVGVEVSVTASSDDGRSQDFDLTVTPEKVVDHARNQYVSAATVEKGGRWARVLVRLRNRSSDTYSLADGQFTLVTKQGDQIFENFSSAPWRDLGTGKLLPGDRRRGWLGFVVPSRATLDELRWEPITGADAVYRWDVSG